MTVRAEAGVRHAQRWKFGNWLGPLAQHGFMGGIICGLRQQTRRREVLHFTQWRQRTPTQPGLIEASWFSGKGSSGPGNTAKTWSATQGAGCRVSIEHGTYHSVYADFTSYGDLPSATAGPARCADQSHVAAVSHTSLFNAIATGGVARPDFYSMHTRRPCVPTRKCSLASGALTDRKSASRHENRWTPTRLRRRAAERKCLATAEIRTRFDRPKPLFGKHLIWHAMCDLSRKESKNRSEIEDIYQPKDEDVNARAS